MEKIILPKEAYSDKIFCEIMFDAAKCKKCNGMRADGFGVCKEHFDKIMNRLSEL